MKNVMKRVGTATVAVLLAVSVAPAIAAPAAEERAALPNKVVVRDSRTSPDDADIAKVVLRSSWYWASEQQVVVSVPDGMRARQRLTVWFDTDLDRMPEGRYDLRLSKGKGKNLRLEQVLRKGETWGTGGTRRPVGACVDEDGDRPVYDVRNGARAVRISFDVFWCFGVQPPGDAPGAWRAVVSLTRGSHGDSAPNRRRWSPALRGWGPCDPSGGSCS